MYVRWRDIEDSPKGMHLEGDIVLEVIQPDERQLLDVGLAHAVLDATQESVGVFRIVGNVHTTLECACSRCLAPTVVHVDAPFDERFVLTSHHFGEAGEDDHLVTDEDGETLDPLLEQSVALAMPTRPLCKADCAGLCPECGVDRNTESCHCLDTPVDPRMSDLAKFFDGE